MAAREGITTDELRNICNGIFELLKDQLSKAGISQKSFDDRMFLYVAEESGRSVVLFPYPFPGPYVDVQPRLEEIMLPDTDLSVEFRRCVAIAFWKPVACDRLDKRIIYNNQIALRQTIASV